MHDSIHKIQKQAKLIYVIKSQNNDYLVRKGLVTKRK